MKKLIVLAAAAGVAAIVARELPAMKRELRILRM